MAGNPKVECAVEAANALGETPLWCGRARKLWWVDIEQPALQWLDPASGAREAFRFGELLGTQALTRDGAHLLAQKLTLHRRDAATGALTRHAEVESVADNRLNDGRVDARGRFWVGSMDRQLDRPNGALYRIDPDRSVTRMFGDVVVSNGIAFAPDSRTFYFTDTRRHLTWAFDFDLDDGRIANRRIFADHRATGARPDGSCVDVDGCIWTAFFGGGRIMRYRPDGTVDRVIPLPVTNPTCACFGGDDLKTLYITTATIFLTPAQRAAEPLAGHVLAIHGMAQGLPEHRFGS